MEDHLITINARKFDETIHRTWKCKLLDETEDYWLFFGEFGEKIIHNDLGIIEKGTKSFEYYWKNRWFNVFRFHQPDGELRNYYCNINFPPTFVNNTLDYIDLDIDVLVWSDFRVEILDRDEFLQNTKKFQYTDLTVSKALAALDEVLANIRDKNFPFDSNDTARSTNLLK